MKKPPLPKRIAYQGIAGAYSHITALKAFGPYNDFIGVKSFSDLFELIHSGQADAGVIPIENSLVGSIYENYDLMSQYEVTILAEHFTRISHCLLACSPRAVDGIDRVWSHPKALEQCRLFLRRNPHLEVLEYEDTAAAAAYIAEEGRAENGAIASEWAAQLYGLEIIAKGIEDQRQNYTRFFSAAKQKLSEPASALETGEAQANKCSLLFKIPHHRGALAAVLQLFAKAECNITKIESRPLLKTGQTAPPKDEQEELSVPSAPFEYIFYLDFAYQPEAKIPIKQLLEHLAKQVWQLKILGFYQAGTL